MPHASPPASAFEFTIDLRRPGYAAGSQAVVEALVRLKAPARHEQAKAPPITLALALDRAASAAALEQAKAFARTVVRRLGARDRAAIVAFDAHARVLCPVVGVADSAALLAAIDAITPATTSDPHAGWLEAGRLLGQSIAGFGVYRVLMIAEAATKMSPIARERLLASCRDLARQGVSTSTYGVGARYDQELMVALAQAGAGHACYGESVGELATGVLTELGLISTVCARGLVLKVNAPPGVQVAMRNDHPPLDASTTSWRLPDLAYGGQAWAYLKLTVPSVYLTEPIAHLPITLSLKAAGTGTPLFFMTALPPLVRMTRADLMAATPNERVEAQREALAAAETLDLVRRLLARGHWRAALVHVEKAERRFGADPSWRDLLRHTRGLAARRQRTSEGAPLPARRMGPLAQEDAPGVPAFLLRRPAQEKGRTRD